MPPRRLSVIVPVLDEAGQVAAALQAARLACPDAELVVVDGGSGDPTPDLARPLCDRLVSTLPGRAHQMNAGAAASRGDVLCFLHIDTALPARAEALIRGALGEIPGRGRPAGRWGRFDVVIEGRHPMLRVVAVAMNRRSRWTGVATGDQAMFVDRALFAAVGGFPDMPLMEDVALSKALRRYSAPVCLSAPVWTSGRRWEANGVARTILTMAFLRLLYWAGVSPRLLAGLYARLKRG